MGKRIELTTVYRPKAPSRTSGVIVTVDPSHLDIVPQRPASYSGGTPMSGGIVIITPSKPGPKPKVEIPDYVQAFLEKHGLRVIPKKKASK